MLKHPQTGCLIAKANLLRQINMSRKHLINSLKITFTALIFYLVFRSVNVSDVLSHFFRVNAHTHLLVLTIALLQTGLMAVRWRAITVISGFIIPLKGSFSAILVSYFFSQGLPSSVGADAFKVWWMKKRDVPLSNVTIIILFDRALGFISLLILCMASIYLLQLKGVLLLDPKMIFSVFVLPIMTFIFVIVITRNRFPISKDWAIFWVLRKNLKEKFHRLYIEIADSIKKPLNHKRQLGIQLMLSVLVHLLTVLMAFLVATDLSSNISFIDCLMVVAPSLLISYLPISIAGWGIREGTFAVAFAMAGFSSEMGLLISILLGTSILIISLFGGIIWAGGGLRKLYLETTSKAKKNFS